MASLLYEPESRDLPSVNCDSRSSVKCPSGDGLSTDRIGSLFVMRDVQSPMLKFPSSSGCHTRSYSLKSQGGIMTASDVLKMKIEQRRSNAWSGCGSAAREVQVRAEARRGDWQLASSSTAGSVSSKGRAVIEDVFSQRLVALYISCLLPSVQAIDSRTRSIAPAFASCPPG